MNSVFWSLGIVVFILTVAARSGLANKIQDPSNPKQGGADYVHDWNKNLNQFSSEILEQLSKIKDPSQRSRRSYNDGQNSGEHEMGPSHDYDGNAHDPVTIRSLRIPDPQTPSLPTSPETILSPEPTVVTPKSLSPTETESLDQKVASRLSRLTQRINNWKTEFGIKRLKNFQHLANHMRQNYETIEASMIDPAIRALRIKIDRAPTCPKSIQAIDTLLEKMKREIDEISQNFQLITPITNQTIKTEQRSFNILASLRGLEPRLQAMDREIFTQPSDDCSRALTRQVANLTNRVTQLRQEEQARLRQSIVDQAAQNIMKGQYDVVGQDLTDLASLLDSVVESSMALQEIVNRTLSFGQSGQFDKILEFIHTLEPPQVKIGMEFLIEIMRNCREKIDSPKFLRLAYEAKRAFGMELKHQFPPSFQQLIWGGTLCIRNKLTNQYLVSDRNETQGGPRGGARNQRRGNSTQTAMPTRLSVHTTRIQRNKKGEVDNRKGKLEFCGWEFYPSVEADSSQLQFVIRQEIKKVWDWNLNVDQDGVEDKPTIFVSSMTVNPNFMWKILSREQGDVFTIQSTNENLLDSQPGPLVNGTGANFLCSTTSGRDRRDVVIQNFGKYCQWHLENPFEN